MFKMPATLLSVKRVLQSPLVIVLSEGNFLTNSGSAGFCLRARHTYVVLHEVKTLK